MAPARRRRCGCFSGCQRRLAAAPSCSAAGSPSSSVPRRGSAPSPTHAELAGEEAQRATFNAAGSTVVLSATLAGLISVTSEFRYGTIRPTLLFEPRRRVVFGAKLVAAALAGVRFAIACVAAAFGAGLGILALRNAGLELTA